jgi:hypothetical protein
MSYRLYPIEIICPRISEPYVQRIEYLAEKVSEGLRIRGSILPN